jgi:hypothetical protein
VGQWLVTARVLALAPALLHVLAGCPLSLYPHKYNLNPKLVASLISLSLSYVCVCVSCQVELSFSHTYVCLSCQVHLSLSRSLALVSSFSLAHALSFFLSSARSLSPSLYEWCSISLSLSLSLYECCGYCRRDWGHRRDWRHKDLTCVFSISKTSLLSSLSSVFSLSHCSYHTCDSLS